LFVLGKARELAELAPISEMQIGAEIAQPAANEILPANSNVWGFTGAFAALVNGER
jgi:hypothetical protein